MIIYMIIYIIDMCVVLGPQTLLMKQATVNLLYYIIYLFV